MTRNMVPQEVIKAQETLIGPWANLDESVVFMFSDPKDLFGQTSLRIKINDFITKRIQYFITINPLGKFIIHSEIAVYPFNNGKFLLEIISEDIIEIKYDETIYTLQKKEDIDSSIFN